MSGDRKHDQFDFAQVTSFEERAHVERFARAAADHLVQFDHMIRSAASAGVPTADLLGQAAEITIMGGDALTELTVRYCGGGVVRRG